MIGRFLLGAGLGALVGTGFLALASLTAPGPGGRQGDVPSQAETVPAQVAADATPAPVLPSAAPTLAPTAVPTAAPTVAPTPVPTAIPTPLPTPVPTAMPSAAPSVAPEPAATPAAPEGPSSALDPAAAPPAAADAPPPAPEAPDMATAPEAPAGAEAPAQPLAPAAPAAPGAETAPEAPATPAAAPAAGSELAAATPEALAPPAPVEGPAAAPLEEAAPAAPADAPAPALVEPAAPPEAAPEAAAPPGLPPLTPEEKALLAEGPQDSPVAPAPETLPAAEAMPEAVPEAAPEAAPAAPPEAAAEAAPEAPALPETITPDAPPAPPESAARKIVVGEGSTLPSTPALIGEGSAEPGPEGVISDRLPRVGDEAAEAGPDERPIARNAAAFDNPAGKPAFAVILIDDGDPALDRAALAALPFPVSFALDPLAPGAAERAAIYRAAGQEVLMLATGLPKGAAASDVEVAFQSMLQALPQAVAVLDLPERAFQNDRVTASMVVAVLGAEGLGLVTWDEGLNAADQVARRADVPAAVAFRALDGEGESTPVIRRYLDRAAFKAAQEGRVTVIGHVRSETLAALAEWAVEGRAATVALAPVTAVLSAN